MRRCRWQHLRHHQKVKVFACEFMRRRGRWRGPVPHHDAADQAVRLTGIHFQEGGSPGGRRWTCRSGSNWLRTLRYVKRAGKFDASCLVIESAGHTHATANQLKTLIIDSTVTDPHERLSFLPRRDPDIDPDLVRIGHFFPIFRRHQMNGPLTSDPFDCTVLG